VPGDRRVLARMACQQPRSERSLDDPAFGHADHCETDKRRGGSRVALEVAGEAASVARTQLSAKCARAVSSMVLPSGRGQALSKLDIARITPLLHDPSGSIERPDGGVAQCGR